MKRTITAVSMNDVQAKMVANACADYAAAAHFVMTIVEKNEVDADKMATEVASDMERLHASMVDGDDTFADIRKLMISWTKKILSRLEGEKWQP